MNPAPWRKLAFRRPRLEPVEPRLVMSSSPSAALGSTALIAAERAPDLQPLGAAADGDLTGVQRARDDYGLTGAGQTVAVIDTGIAYTHAALGGGLGAGYRVVGGYDFTGEDPADPYDDGPLGSHGTHIAGIIASDDVARPGVAPEVDLVALRVFDDSGATSFSRVEAALRWVHENRYAFASPITTVNLSLGVDENNLSASGANQLEDELAQLYADGIFVAAAAGNNFTAYAAPGVTYPASSPFVVPVASVDPQGTLSSYSQRSSRVIAAPGRAVLGSVPDYAGNLNGLDDDFARYSGTSMATAYVSGASVLLRQAYHQVGIHDVGVDRLYNDLLASADTVYDPATGQDYHRLNLGRAVDTVLQQYGAARGSGTVGAYDPDRGLFLIQAPGGLTSTTLTISPRKPGCVPIVGDWNGDGTDTVGVYDPGTSTFYLKNADRSGSAEVSYSFGTRNAGWVPVAGDWNGDGVDSVGLYNPATGTFYLKNTHTSRSAEIVFTVRGTQRSWVPLSGDWDGDGLTNVGVYDASTATAYLKTRNATGAPERSFEAGTRYAGWLPVAGDWDQDGVESLGLYNPSSGAFVLKNGFTAAATESTLVLGGVGPAWKPIVGNWESSAVVASQRSTTMSTGNRLTAADLGRAPEAAAVNTPSPGSSDAAPWPVHAPASPLPSPALPLADRPMSVDRTSTGGLPSAMSDAARAMVAWSPNPGTAQGPVCGPAQLGSWATPSTEGNAGLPAAPGVQSRAGGVGGTAAANPASSASAQWRGAERLSFLNSVLSQLKSLSSRDEQTLAWQAARRQLAAELAQTDSVFADDEVQQDFADEVAGKLAYPDEA